MTEKKKKWLICGIVILGCGIMGIVDGIIRPGYVLKSLVKICMFLLLPVTYSRFDPDLNLKALLIPGKKGLLTAAGVGVGVYAVIFGGYLLLRNVFDFSNIAASVTAQNGVNKDNFLYVALYISLVNSLLEEFFFRGFGYLTLKKVSTRRFAAVFSASFFALYHVCMMLGWYSGVAEVVITLAGLFAGGMIFNFFDDRQNHIILSWVIHLFANLATNTIGFLLFQA